MGEIFAKHIFKKGFGSRLCKTQLQLNNKKTNDKFFLKRVKNLNRHFTHNSKQIAFKDVNHINHQGNGN